MSRMKLGDCRLPSKFWDKVLPEPNSGCWLWTGAALPAGYGSFRHEGHPRKAHRVIMSVIENVDGWCVLHRCDTPPCVNPDHLFLGTIADNNADKMSKGRHRSGTGDRSSRRLHPDSYASGEDHYNAKLSHAQVEEIRRMWAAGGTRQVDIGKRFGIAQVTVGRIVRREVYKSCK